MLRETFAPIDKFDEMNKFLGSHKLPKLIQMIKKEIWTVALKPSKKKKNFHQKTPGPQGFSDECYQIFREEIIPILYKPFRKIDEGDILLNLFYEAILHVKLDKDIIRKLQTNILHEHRSKNF